MSEKQSWDMELNELKFWGFVGWIALFVLVVVAIVGLNKRLSSLEEVYSDSQSDLYEHYLGNASWECAEWNYGGDQTCEYENGSRFRMDFNFNSTSKFSPPACPIDSKIISGGAGGFCSLRVLTRKGV